ncbi:MAG: hypothetical protein SWX82_19135 [Cyanobacteriota bacterium]|nr:hypothetical protein [Cyanobacteriota bacterium]
MVISGVQDKIYRRFFRASENDCGMRVGNIIEVAIAATENKKWEENSLLPEVVHSHIHISFLSLTK